MNANAPVGVLVMGVLLLTIKDIAKPIVMSTEETIIAGHPTPTNKGHTLTVQGVKKVS